jgi:NAD(P)-dependent dehydrogenase (short-subunit alcohol dehydrogenase family)
MNPRITDWRARRVGLIGASAGIGEALAIALASRGARLTLSARNGEALRVVAARANAPALILPCDVADAASVAAAWQTLLARWGGCDLVIYMAGAWQPLSAAMPTAELLPAARQTVAVNFGGALEVVGHLAPWLVARQADRAISGPSGIVLVASVAGYRGLPKALAYSASKAALIALAESLYHELSPRGLGVWLVNPGFVKTRLTASNDFRMPALIGVGEAVDEILAGLAAGRFEIHFPRRFTRVMKLLRLLPASLYFALLRRLVPAGGGGR